MNDFALTVRAALKQRGTSIRSAAVAINYDPAYLSRVLSGHQRPSIGLAEKLDVYLGADGALVALAQTLSDDDHGRVAHSVEQPTRTDARTVTALADVLAAQRRLDDTVDAAVMLPGVLAQWKKTVHILARDSRGKHAAGVRAVAAEWIQFIGWLHAEARNDDEAARWLTEAENRADDLGDGVLAAQATNFRGYSARQQNRPIGIVRAFTAAYHTPGSSPLQRVDNMAQAAHGLAMLGQAREARDLLHEAETLAERSADVEAPATAYWLSPTFSRINIGLAYLALGDHADAEANLSYGLGNLPADQQRSEWALEYRRALEDARARG